MTFLSTIRDLSMNIMKNFSSILLILRIFNAMSARGESHVPKNLRLMLLTSVGVRIANET